MIMREIIRIDFTVLFVLVIFGGVGSFVFGGQLANYKVALAQPTKINNFSINVANSTMLCELIYESTGRIIGQRVVDADDNGPSAKVEVSYSGTGYIQGVGNVTETWTFVNTHLPKNITQGVGEGVVMTDDGGGIATAKELGRGFHISPDTIVYPGARFFSTDPNGKLAFLNEVVGVTQWEVNSMGNYNVKMWQWK